MKKVPIDRLIAAIAAKQHGHITYQQLIGLGLSRSAIDVRVKKGQLIRVHRGVYAVGHPRPEGVARAAAAVLACGPYGVLSHFSAAALWDLTRWPHLHEVTVPARRRPSGIWVHVCPTLESRDIRKHRDIRLTSPARTLLDIAPRQTDAGRDRAVSQAILNKLLRPDRLEAALNRYPHHQGVPLLRHPRDPTRSDFERLFPPFCRRYNLPIPQMNAHVAGHEVDALFEAEKVIVELDSWTFHKDRRSFENDRERDATTLAADHATIRLTWQRFTSRPDEEATRLHSILESRR